MFWGKIRKPQDNSVQRTGAFILAAFVVIAFIASDPARTIIGYFFGEYEPDKQWQASLNTMANMALGSILTVIAQKYKSAEGRELAKRIRPVCDECPLHEWTQTKKNNKD